MNFLQKILKPGIYLLAFLLPLQTRLIIKPGELYGGYWEYGTLSLYATDLLLILLLFIFIIPKFLIKLKNKKPEAESNPEDLVAVEACRTDSMSDNKLYLLIIGLNLITLISIFFAVNRPVAIQAYLRLTLGMGLFFLVVQPVLKYGRLLYSFLAGAALQATFALWQFLAQATFESKWLGMAGHPAAAGGSSVIETITGGRWLRAYGGLDHPNVLGGFLAISTLLTVYLMLRNETGDKISNFQISISNNTQNPKFSADGHSDKINNFILYSIFFIVLSALFFTFSRGAWLGLIVGFIIILAFNFYYKNKSAFRKLIFLIISASFLVGILGFVYSDLITTRFSGLSRLEIKSNQERVASYRDASKIIKNNWFFGVGIGGYTAALIKSYPSQPAWFYQPTHNVFLLVWAELGIVGLILFVAILIYILIFNFQFFSPQRDPAEAVAIFKQFLIFNLPKNLEIQNSSFNQNSKFLIQNSNTRLSTRDNYLNLSILLPLIILMLPDHYFWSLHFGVLFFWFSLGLAVRIEPRVDFTE